MRVSVCMATYNGSMYISSQLESILSQLGDNDEIVISDDGSSDNTLSVISDFNDRRIKVITNQSAIKGVVSNFNNALQHASGKYIFLSDQDDVWLENRIINSLELLKDNDLIVSNCIVIDQNGKVVLDSYFDMAKSGRGFFKNLLSSSYLGCGLAFNRKVFDFFMPIPKDLMMYHDWWIGFIADAKFKVYFDQRKSFLYRRHNNTASNTVGKSNRTFFIKTTSRVQLLFKGVTRLIRRSYDI